MKKKEIVKSKQDFDSIIKTGKKISNRYYHVFYQKADETLFGIAVSKKLGNAVFRNKNKRQLRNILNKNKNIFKNNRKYIIMIKGEGVKLSYNEKEIKLIDLMKGEQ